MTIKVEIKKTGVAKMDEQKATGTEILYAICPSCTELIIYLNKGSLRKNPLGFWEVGISTSKDMIYPKRSNFESPDIPQVFLSDYEEAIKVLGVSPKASAALTRRLLQNILREKFDIKENSLSEEIKAFILLSGVPTHLTDAVDAIRIIGNLAAHPTKNKNSGEIVPVEVGEAEWLIQVIDALFDFAFIQPVKLEKRKKELNIKLEEAGRQSMK